jgi:hypothetical protein
VSGESNGAWGELAAENDELADVWDGFERLPEAGVNDELDAFLARKNITRRALLRVGARMATPTTLAFAGNHYLKYRDLLTDRRWNYVGSTFPELKIVRAGATPSDTVIVCEGETDAARLVGLYPTADVASLPAGAKRFTSKYAAQLADYPRVVVGLDPDQAGDEGAAKIMGFIPHAVRLTAGDGDWCELEGDAPPLPDAPAAAGLLAYRMLLGQKLRDGIEPPEFLDTPSLGPSLFYRHHLFLISGHKKAGKTLVMMAVALDHMRAGHPVVYVDLENGPEIIGERLLMLGAEPDSLDELFVYLPFPKGLTLESFGPQLEQVAQEYPQALLVFDSFRGMFARLSGTAGKPLSPNDPIDIERVLGPINDVVKTSHITAGVIDHAKKGGAASDEYATANSVGKEQVADVVYFVHKDEAYGEDHPGVLSLKVSSDRRGRLPQQPVHWRVGGQGAGNRFSFAPVNAGDVGTSARIRSDLERFLKAHPDESFTKSVLEEEVRGKADLIRGALEQLANDPERPIVCEPGSRKGSTAYRYDANAVLTSSDPRI